ncbi:unnamed protein product, partial [Hymenolepis diminuta]
FPELLFIHILYDNISVFRPRSWSDVFYVSVTLKPYLSLSKHVHGFFSFFNRLISPKKYIYTDVLTRPHSSDSYKAVFVFHSKDNARMSVTGSYASSSSPLFLIMLPSLSLSLSPSL